MIFNRDLTKQAQEVIFSRKTKKLHSCLSFNNFPLKNSISQKHLGLTLDITQKINKTMGLLHRFQRKFPKSSLLTIHKTFIRSQSDFADVIYDQACNSSFHDSNLFNTMLAWQ